MEGRESRLNAHINPTIGEVPVVKWRVEHSRAVMEKGRRTLFSQRGREDLRGQLSALRKLAWRLGWLDRSVDPLDGLEIGRANVLHDATAQYVDPRLRPETRQVRAVVKNHVVHEVPLPRSLMHEELLPRVKELLGLPAKASLQQVIGAQEAERQRRSSLAYP